MNDQVIYRTLYIEQKTNLETLSVRYFGGFNSLVYKINSSKVLFTSFM